MKKDDTLTIPEVAKILNKSINTIYRYIKQKKLKTITGIYQNRKVDRVKKADLERFCKDNNITYYNGVITDNTTHDNGDYNSVTMPDITEEIKQAVNNSLSLYHKDFLEKVFNAGVLTKENQFLTDRLETVLQENKDLQEKLKALPDLKTIQEKEKDLMIQIELERQEKADILSRGEAIQKEQEEKHRRELAELETRQEEQNELHRQELEQVKQEHKRTLKLMSESAEKEKMEIVEAWKKKTEELERPWWKFW